jgi:heme-degrading monooxygenase HmoA
MATTRAERHPADPRRRDPNAAIARVWHAWAAPEKANEYEQYVSQEVIPGYVGMPGYLGAAYHRRDDGDEVEFLVITRWESFDAIIAFAGADNPAQTTIPQRAADMLLRCDAAATHYEDIPIAWPEGFTAR